MGHGGMAVEPLRGGASAEPLCGGRALSWGRSGGTSSRWHMIGGGEVMAACRWVVGCGTLAEMEP
jgi:hypothetical protein